ncbi:MAG: carboxypeptidase regulatory-like domain-containing protein [Gemmatimonadales bacterium]
MLRRILLIVALAFVAPVAVLRAQGVDVIRGQVTGPDGAPIENANVTATSVSGGVNRFARTDRNGRFTITFPGGEGDYFMGYTAIGFSPRRFELKRMADEDILVGDARLARAAAILDTMHIAADRQRVDRNADKVPDISGTEQAANAAAVSAAQQGDLNAMAATIPGVTAVLGADGDPAGFSVLGLSADQNTTTLNGSPFGASNLPRDANVSTSVVTTPYDVSRGGFSGGQLNIRTGSGSNYIRRSSSLNFDAPPLQWTDPAARALGQQYTNLSLGGSLSGPISFDKAFYNVAYQLGRRSSDLHSLLNTSDVGLQASGISADSVAHLISLLNGAGVPLMVDGRIPSDRLTDNGSVFGSLDFTPPRSTSGQTFNVTFNGYWNRQSPIGQLSTEVPAHSGDRTSVFGGVQGTHTAYVKNVVLSETTVGLNANRSYGSPYTELPSGSVLVNSVFPDGTSSVRTLGFGGSPSLSTKSSTIGLSAMNQLSWFSRNNKHRIKLTSELRQDSYNQDQTSNLLGSFYYTSLAALQANQPASFSRSLLPRTQSAGQTVGALSLGDSYKRTSDLQIQYGVRVDANHFSSSPVFNPAVQQQFGIRNDEAPNDIYFSPRIGFAWTYGEAPQIAAFEGAARVPRAVVRGGVGVFQNVGSASLIGSAIDNTGLPGAVQQLSCVGVATPLPDWSAYAQDPSTIPVTCADGSTGTVFANSAPNVTLFAKNYSAPRSVRGNLQWNGPILNNRFNATIEGTYSRNLDQRSFVDLNFRPTVQFLLPDEGGRPVFVQPGSIVPGTGAIAVGDARVSPQFNRVSEQVSDLIGETKQLRFSLSPTTFSSNFTWSASYVLTDNRMQFRGFSSTVSDPTKVEWSTGDISSRHQITYNLGYNFFDAVRVNWFGRFSSGTSFTPLISGDVNGDGYNNDRAYVFDPATASDPAVASAMSALLAGSGRAKDCLASQLGQLATRNSCMGPWTSSANLALSLNPLKFRLPQRANLSFSVSNPLGAADILLHGENGLHGWGQGASPDQTLLYVRGFDPATERFRYQVNPRFGSTNPQFANFRMPVTVTMQLRVDVGPSRERQMLTQQLDRGRVHEGMKLTEPMLKAMYGSGGVLNPMSQMLRQSDTLQLTGPQADSLATMNRTYTIRLDSIWTGVAHDLATLPDRYDQGEAYDRYRRAREASVDLLIALAPRIKALLTDEQLRKLPPLVASHLDTRYLAGIRSGTQGDTGGGVFMGLRGAGGGGGGQRVIIRQ